MTPTKVVSTCQPPPTVIVPRGVLPPNGAITVRFSAPPNSPVTITVTLSRVIAANLPVGRDSRRHGHTTAPVLLHGGNGRGEAVTADVPAPTLTLHDALYPRTPVDARGHGRGVTVVLYRATVRARANGRGQVAARIHIGYAVRQRVEALLNVTVQTRRGRSMLRVRVTLTPTGHYTHEGNHTRNGH